MTLNPHELLKIHETPSLTDATLVLAFSGWMDGGDVSTGTVERLVDLLDAEPIAEIDPEPFYIYNFPGLDGNRRPVPAAHRDRRRHGQVDRHADQHVLLSTSRPTWCCSSARSRTCSWRTFGECIFHLRREVGVGRILFVGSFGGSVPHTREPRLYVTCSDAEAAAGDGASTASAAPATRAPARSPAT